MKPARSDIRRTLLLTAALLAASCSTTRRLAEGEVLYTGVRRIRIEPDSGVRITAAAESAAKAPLSAAPNNPLYSPFLRTPLPTGLWAYNYLHTPKERGFKHWLYKRLAKEPVLLSKVRPELRAKVAAQMLGNYGYFGSQVESRLLPRKRGLKAKVSYTLHVARPYRYASIEYIPPTGQLAPLIDSLRATSLLRRGAQYDLGTLTRERQRIATTLRNRGYYYFRPQYLEYLADTTVGEHRADIRLRLHPSTPPKALRPYRTGRVTVRLTGPEAGDTDTLHLAHATVIAQRPPRLRPRLLERAIAFDPGARLTVEAQNRTLTELNKLGVFRSVRLDVPPIDSLGQSDTLDIAIEARFELPISADFETDVVSKSNSFLGPGLSFKVSHNNLFRGGEKFAVKLNGSYEWQTGNRQSGGRDSRLNSYEFGLTASLDIPRLLLPGMARRGRSTAGNSSFQLGLSLMNRPDYFRMLSFGGAAGYSFHTSPYSLHALTLLKLTYNKLLRTTQSFDTTMAENPTIALSFRDQFVPSVSYTYTFDRTYGPASRRRLFWQNSVTSAGNLLSALLGIFGEHHPQRLFDNRFSQFVKEVSDLRFFLRLGRRDTWLATRLVVGAGYAYGNSEVMPYGEQFYIGGANSIRAFTVRSIGPGSYRPPHDDRNGYLDQTGDFKLEANVELRFGIMGRLHGAVFLDAGNIWLLKKDPQRPGAELDWHGFFNEIALGTGFGLRYDISYLVLRADLGIGLHTPYSTPGRRGYYNIARFRDGLGFHLAIGYPF